MNYIPGFTNYLETTVPEYGPAPIMDAGPVVPQRAAVAPMTTEAAPAEAAAPYDLSALAGLDLSGLDSLYGMNFSNFGGGPMGGQYQTDPNLQYIGAPKSNKGNATSKTGGNVFAVRVDQPVRLVDHRTNQVVFEGTGFDAARKATELGQGLTDQFGRKANYSIQTADPAGNYSTVAYEKKNKSTLGEIANVVGTVAPLALGFVPGFGQLSLLAKMGAAAGAGGLGAALKGDDILKGALLSGATAGIVSGTGLDKAIGGALGSLGKGATQGAVTAGSKAAADATGDIIATGLSKVLQGTGSALGQAALSEAGNATSRALSGYKTPAEQFAQQPLPEAVQPFADMYAGLDPIDVTALSRLTQGTGNAIGNAALSGVVKGPLSDTASTDQPKPTEKTAEDIEAEKNPMVVTGPKNLLPADFATSAAAAAAANAANGAADAPDRAEMTDAELDAYMNDVSKGGGLGSLLSDMTLAQKVNLLGLGVSAAGSLAGGGGGSGQTGTYGGTGSGRLNPIFSAKLPSAGGLGTIGANRTARPMGDVDWLTYGTRPELNFFDYAAQNNPAPITTPVPGNPAGPIMAEDKIRHSEEGIPLWMQLGLPNPNAPAAQPAGQIMEERDPMAMAEGGAFAAKRGGRSRRTEFAVNGPGTGRSDDIPAVLSDGEYVIDAETVALLGDGSSKAGAKKLDDLRVKVRKHKGKKLAKGRFSANAKRPEAYLSGGRI